MFPFFSFILIAGAGFTLSSLLDSNSSPSDDDSVPPAENDEIEFLDNSIIGTDGDDVIDDSQFSEEDDAVLGRGFIAVEGGAGNDTIIIEENVASLIDGGDGDDNIQGTVFGSILGGDGDDIIATSGDNTIVYGGNGNDDLSVAGIGEPGAGYVVAAYGGDGDDILRHTGEGYTLFTEYFGPATLTGGAGTDQFVLTTTEGSHTVEEGTEISDVDPGVDDTVTLGGVRIDDFTTGEDVIVIDATPEDESFDLISARLEQTTDSYGDPITNIVLSYESDTDFNRDVAITLLGGGVLNWDDISFTGADTPILL